MERRAELAALQSGRCDRSGAMAAAVTDGEVASERWRVKVTTAPQILPLTRHGGDRSSLNASQDALEALNDLDTCETIEAPPMGHDWMERYLHDLRTLHDSHHGDSPALSVRATVWAMPSRS